MTNHKRGDHSDDRDDTEPCYCQENPMEQLKSSDQVWDEAVTANQALVEKQIYQKGFGDGHKDAREYMKKLIKDEIWMYHELFPGFLKEHKVGIEKAINELCMKSHNEVLEKLIKLL